MDYYINPSVLTSVFTVPSVAVDRYLKFAKPEHVKVLLYIMRNMAEELTEQNVSEQTNVSAYDVKEALLYWADCGILMPKTQPVEEEKPGRNTTVRRAEKPKREDIARRGNEDVKIQYLLREAQLKLGRNLKSNETATLVWLYEDEGLDVSLILLIIQYAVSNKKANIRFIEATAVDWINKGIDTIADAEEELRKIVFREQAWSIVSAQFGLERRKPSQKEAELSFKWINEWKLTSQTLSAAYDECVNAKSKFSFAYTAKILENWHEQNGDKPMEKKKNQSDSENLPSYDLDLFERTLNTKD